MSSRLVPRIARSSLGGLFRRLVAVSISVGSVRTAGAAEPPAAAPAAAPAASVTARTFDAGLERVIQTGCAEGTDDVAFGRGDLSDEERAVRDHILRLCAGVRQRERPSLSVERDRSGRARLIFFGAVYGVVAGLEAEYAGHIDFSEPRYYVLPPLGGMTLGLAIAVFGTRDGDVTAGQAWTVMSGFDYGTYLGWLWATGASADSHDSAAVALATGLTGGFGAITAAKLLRPSQGDAEIFRSGGLWGAAAGFYSAFLFAGHTSGLSLDGAAETTAAGMTFGLLTGAMVARNTDLSRARVLIIDTGGLVGSLVGMSGVWLVRGRELDARFFGGGGILGLVTGLIVASLATRGWHEHDGPLVASTATRGPVAVSLPEMSEPGRAQSFPWHVTVPLWAGTF